MKSGPDEQCAAQEMPAALESLHRIVLFFRRGGHFLPTLVIVEVAELGRFWI